MPPALIDPALKASTIEHINAWPIVDRVDLVRSILANIEKEETPSGSREGIRSLIGCWQDIQPTPTDAEIKRILHEERLRKFT